MLLDDVSAQASLLVCLFTQVTGLSMRPETRKDGKNLPPESLSVCVERIKLSPNYNRTKVRAN